MAEKNYEKSPPRWVPGGNFWKINSNASESLDIEHLTIAVIATGWARNVRWHFTAAFRAALEDRCTPASGATAHFLTAFGLAALWYGHSLEFV